jgi:hypothetical protein
MQTPTTLPIIPLTRDSRVDSSHLDLIRKVLRGNTLAITYLPNMLRCRSPYDQPRAAVSYGNTTFLFSRSIETTKDQDH